MKELVFLYADIVQEYDKANKWADEIKGKYCRTKKGGQELLKNIDYQCACMKAYNLKGFSHRLWTIIKMSMTNNE